MKNRSGLSGGHYKPLTEEDIKEIHQTSLRVFSDIGVQVNLKEALDLFKAAGAAADPSTRIVKIPPDLVESLIDRAPAVVRFCARDKGGRLDCEIGGARVYMGTGGTALNVQDPGETTARPSNLQDIADMARLVDALDHIHLYMLNVYPNELSVECVDVNRFGAALNNTRKHIMGGVYTLEGVRQVIRMAEMIAGSAEKLRQRPFISMVSCNISPFKLDEHYGRLTVEIARSGIPVVTPAEPLCGATAPITLAGNLVVQNVDSLIGVMLTQLVNPGTPVLYGCISSITDLRDMKYLSGAIEMGLMNAASAQMAQFYRLPLYSTAGMSDAKVNDAQAGYETALTGLMVALAGGNFIHDAAGFLEFCMTASYDKLVIDNEIIGMIMRAVEGIAVNEDTLAFDLLKEIGPGGHFVSARHTRKHMRKEQYHPQLSDRDNRAQWLQSGAKTAAARATEKVQDILNHPSSGILSPKVREQIKVEIPGLQPDIL